MTDKAFTLIELLIVIVIIGIMVTIASFGIRGSRETARDAKRRTDLQTIKAALELYYTDCGAYPTPTSGSPPNPIESSGSGGCPANVYMSDVPEDPQPTAKKYFYALAGSGYILCTSLEEPPNPAVDITGCNGAYDCTEACNFKVTGP